MSYKKQIRTAKGQFGKLKVELRTLEDMTDSEIYAQREILIGQLGVLEFERALTLHYATEVGREINNRELLKKQGEVPHV